MTYIEDTFKEGGLLSKQIPNYQMREPQVELAQSIHDALIDGAHLVAEAPTGTGKSIGYLVPALQQAIGGEQILVCTANIALQEQLIKKDLPLLQRVIPQPFNFGLAKGRSHYVCKLAFSELREKLAPEVVDWVIETETGDFAELAEEESMIDREHTIKYARNLLSGKSEKCIGKKCSYHENCYINLARIRCQEMTVVVANYHLLFAHLRVKELTEGAVQILPDFSFLVMDEANKAPDIARAFFGRKMSFYAIRDLSSELRRIPGASKLYFCLMQAAKEFFEWLPTLSPYSNKRKSFLYTQLPEDRWRTLYDLLVYVSSFFESVGLKKPSSLSKMNAARLKWFSDSSNDPDQVFFIEPKKGMGVLNSKVINIGPRLEELLWSRVTSIHTSATLTVKRSFEYHLSETGLPESTRTTIVDTPFDLYNQAAIVIPKHLPVPCSNSKKNADHYFDWSRSVIDEIEKMAKKTSGRMLCLFSSCSMLDLAAKKLPKRLDFNIFAQTEPALRSKIVKQFLTDEHSILLGTESFWSGIDCPGMTCSIVVIDKIPFTPPDDPLMMAFEIQNPGKSFRMHSIPRAVIQLKQGIGRLIRTSEDTGIIVILDKRMLISNYRTTFLASLPNMRPAKKVSKKLIKKLIEK